MSLIDKVMDAIGPLESEEARQHARDNARQASSPGDWLSLVLDHHEKIEAAFLVVKEAGTEPTQRAALKKLAVLLSGHSLAEEAVLYPALAALDENAHAVRAYAEQSAAKLQLGLLERLIPLTPAYLDKLEEIRAAVAHHVYEEESSWFLTIQRGASAAEQELLSVRYREEFTRYVGIAAELRDGLGAEPEAPLSGRAPIGDSRTRLDNGFV